jgi:hypothetical protein
MAEQSRALLQDFFRHRREQKKQLRQQLRTNQ